MDGTVSEGPNADADVVSRTVTSLRSELADTELDRHLALFFRSVETQLEAVAAFINHGLQRNQRCLYLADVHTPQQIEDALRAGAIDVEAARDAGDLALEDASEVYLEAGFDPDRMIERLQRACEESLSAGYDGLYVAGENSWCFHTEVEFDHVLDFEAEFDAVAPDLPVTALCQYDLDRFGERSTAKALRTHRQVIYRHAICENPFYVSPNDYRAAANPHENAQFMLEQAYDLTRARRQVSRREQRLEVVNRVLRHNIRNDINVVRGVLESLTDADGAITSVDAGGEAVAPDQLETALRRTEDIVEMADRARYVQRTIDDPAVETVDLGTIVTSAVDEVGRRYPRAEVTVDVGTNPLVLADENLDLALIELLTNAIEHQHADPPTVSVTLSSPTADTVQLDLTNPGPPIPRHERRTLQRGYETPLEHGSGLGLWLIKWIVENANGDLEIPETDDDSGRITIRLFRAA